MAAFALGAAAARAATVRALTLPAGFTINPEGDRRLMTLGPDGAVYAIVTPIEARSTGARAVRWDARNTRRMFAPIRQRYDDLAMSAPNADGIAPTAAGALVTIGRTHDGAYIGTQFRTDRWVGAHTAAWEPPPCAEADASTHVYASDGAALALTVDPSSNSTGIDLDDPNAVENNLPRAVVLDAGSCRSLGPAILTGMRGVSVVGYVGYLAGRRAPWFINLMVQRMLATRWIGSRREELGPGVPFAVTANGVAAGASALPGHAAESLTGNFLGPAATYRFATPHAVLWPRSGNRITLFRHDGRSVAWDVDPAETVVGCVQGADGVHRAFRRSRSGKLELLDRLPHPANWRFESAYAIGADGAIAGIGTRNGIATAFLWRP